MVIDNSYTIQIDRTFVRCVEKLPSQIKHMLDKKMELFRNNPSHHGLNVKPYCISNKKLKQLGIDDLYEFWIDRKFRCMFYAFAEPKKIIFAYVGNHSNIKKRFTK